MVTFTTGAAYDPKVHTLIDILNYTQIITQKTDNEYEVNVYEWLDESPIKRWFRPRTAECVGTYIGIEYGTYKEYIIISEPDPFKSKCINEMEWLLIACVSSLIIGVVSLVFLGRKGRFYFRWLENIIIESRIRYL